MTSQASPNMLVPIRMDRFIPLIIWLSLDAIGPRLSSTGFSGRTTHEATWLGILRRAIRHTAAARWADPSAPATLVGDVLGAVAHELGEAVALDFLRFGRFTFAMGAEDHPELFAWRALFEVCQAEPSALEALAPWQDVRARIQEGLGSTPPVRTAAPLTLPLSAWDVAMLALRGIDDADLAAPEHPVRLCDWTARVTLARAHWRTILPLLDERRREALVWEGSRLAGSLGILPRDISLPDPLTLVEHIHG
jgi:hypothetical protein